MNVKTYADLYADTLALIPRLPRISSVYGVPRSGMLPAAIIATELNVPLGMCGARVTGGGQRLERRRRSGGSVLVIDDSVSSGHAMRQARRQVPGAVYAALYMRPGRGEHVDIFGEVLPRPRIFAWSLWHSAFIERCLVDFDGVLCADPPVPDDDGPAYQAAIESAVPLFRPRKVRGIVTNRLELWRPQTEAWLAEHGIEYGTLTMNPSANARARRRSDVAAYKAAAYSATDAPLFIESSDAQAERIAAISGRPALAVPSWRLWRGRIAAEG